MAQMIRKQIYIDADNARFLKERSSELGVTEAQIVRQALADAERKACAEAEQRAKDEKRLAALDNILTYIREHRMSADPSSDDSQGGWVFNRDELYDERMDRYGPQRDEEPEQYGG
ncbi:MAG TPA: hypothetical protein VFV93_02545 [Thermomicrobiales bacterium]|nr:hypothetical protein [Thermomicrobiales bacterium]